MTEVEKMRSSQLADMAAPELQVRFEHAKKLLARMRGMSTYDEGYRELLEELVPEIPETSIICPPFHCDHGDGIKLGEHVFVNANCTFLDGGYITIGAPYAGWTLCTDLYAGSSRGLTGEKRL